MQEENAKCEYHAREIEVLRAITQETREEVLVMQEVFKRWDKALFGNGTPGVIEKLQTKIATHDKMIYIGMGVIATMQFLSGNGVLSLKALLGK